MSELTDFIKKELIELDYGCEYGGISEPTMAQLFTLKGLVEQHLYILRNKENMNTSSINHCDKHGGYGFVIDCIECNSNT